MISLWGLDGRAEEHESILRSPVRNYIEKRSRVGQVLGKHRGYDPLVFSVRARAVSFQRIFDREADPASVSGDGQQPICYCYRWWADIEAINLNVRPLFCSQNAQATVPCTHLQHRRVLI